MEECSSLSSGSAIPTSSVRSLTESETETKSKMSSLKRFRRPFNVGKKLNNKSAVERNGGEINNSSHHEKEDQQDQLNTDVQPEIKKRRQKNKKSKSLSLDVTNSSMGDDSTQISELTIPNSKPKKKKKKKKKSIASSTVVSHDGHDESEQRLDQLGEGSNDEDLDQVPVRDILAVEAPIGSEKKKKKKKKSKRKNTQAVTDGLEVVEAGKVDQLVEASRESTFTKKTRKVSSNIVNDTAAAGLDSSPKGTQDVNTQKEDSAPETNHNIYIATSPMDEVSAESDVEEAKIEDDATMGVALDPEYSQASNGNPEQPTSEVAVDCEVDSADAKTDEAEQEEAQVQMFPTVEEHGRDGDIEDVIQAQDNIHSELVPINEETSQVQLVPTVEEHGRHDDGVSESDMSELKDDRNSVSTDRYVQDIPSQVDVSKVLGGDNSVASETVVSQDEGTSSAALRKQVEQLQEQLRQQQLKTRMLEESVAIDKSKNSAETINRNAEITLYKGMVEDLQEDYDMVGGKYEEQMEMNAQHLALMGKMKNEALEFESVLQEKTDRIQALEQELLALQKSEDDQLLIELKDKNDRLQKMVNLQKQSLFRVLKESGRKSWF